jgi:hypothetical protein
MEDIRIILSALWVALMLTYLLGDVLRVYAGDFKAGQFGGMPMSQSTFLVAAIIMLVPIVMLLLSVTLLYPLVRWVNIIAAVAMLIFNLIGLPGYPGAYDKFLIIVGLFINGITVWYAWTWV